MASTTPTTAPIGTVLEAKFRVTREIGRGGMAAVYEAENIDIGKRVAVKILAPELITSKIVRERFIREARATASIRSPYICDVYDSGMYEDRPFLVMELLEGESLYDMMTRVRRLDVATTLRIANHTMRALAKAHESTIVHRDLKPENIFLTKDEDGELLAKILDFGLAKFYEPVQGAQSVRLTREGALFGTPAYMSPEQARGQGEVDHRADLWALGCIVYECLIGQTVWNVEQGVAMILAQIAGAPLPRPSKVRPDLPASFDQWFYKALERDMTRRFQSAKEMSDALEDAFTTPNLQRPPVSVHNDSEAVSVDELIRVSEDREGADTPVETPRGTPHPPSGAPDAGPMTTGPAPPSNGARAISFLFVLGALALGGYAVWLYVLHPPGALRVVPETATLPEAEGSAPRGAPRAKVVSFEGEPYAKKLAEAQALLATDGKRSLELFREAFQDGSMPAARSLLSHATVSVEEVGACRVTGLARPRPFALEVPVARPSLAPTSKGVVISWVDNHQDARRRQAFTVLLDSALRRISAPVQVTPEAQNVRQPQLARAGDQLALVYWDESGDGQGLYVRMLDAQGRILSPARKLTNSPKARHPAITPAPNGDYWTVWEEELDDGTTDIVARRLGKELENKGEPVRLATLRGALGPNRQPRMPDLAIEHGRLYVVFARDVAPQRLEVLLQSVPLDEPRLTTGLVPRDPKAGRAPRLQPGKTFGTDFPGSLKPIGEATGRNAQARIACARDGCFVAWDDEKAGAFTAFVDRERGLLWHRDFARKGLRPALGRDGRGVVVSWYEDGRVKLAPLSRDGLGKPSTLTRVNGLQPNADVTPGEKPGEWLIAFRDYEAAHFEVFALRAECR